MTKQIAILPILVFSIISSLWAQKDDPVLFTVNDTPVHLSEFTYIYTKTNGKNADFSKPSLEEYLDLYIKFKLKVEKAKEMQLDTIPQLARELEGYRRQLADSYLIDKKVTEQLIKEAYERNKQDVDISHILIAVRPKAAPADTLAAFNKALTAKKRLESGEDWAAVAGELSDDKSVKRNGGRIGYITALFPNGFYPLETAAYEAPAGKITGPVRTSAGYHILKVHGRRPARGELEAAHILLRAKEENAEAVKSRIDSVYQALEGGANFSKLANAVSEDNSSAGKGGYIGFFGINRYDKVFEEAAFAIPEDEAYSKPVRSAAGWHIIKRISKKDIQPYNVEKSRLEAQIRKDDRFEEAKLAMIQHIKEENNFYENKKMLDHFIGSLTDTFLTFKWKAPEEKSPEMLFAFDDYKVTLGDFTDYLGRATSKRLRMGRNTDLKEAVNSLYREFVDENALKYEETQLEDKYPDFKALMREYEEGILLFEATKILVWDKASQDTSGLKEFYKTIYGKYRWRERAATTVYRLRKDYEDQIEEIRAYAKDHSREEVLERFNEAEQIVLTAEEKNFEKDRNPDVAAMDWEVGALSQTEELARNKMLKFIKIEKILPPEIKTLQEARGYVVADYQDQLEKQWVESLKEAYEVDVNKKVFESMIKKGE